ncbi:MAG: hypothetical protein U0Q12_07255 [Vicinamibacterales bacterium]
MSPDDLVATFLAGLRSHLAQGEAELTAGLAATRETVHDELAAARAAVARLERDNRNLRDQIDYLQDRIADLDRAVRSHHVAAVRTGVVASVTPEPRQGPPPAAHPHRLLASALSALRRHATLSETLASTASAASLLGNAGLVVVHSRSGWAAWRSTGTRSDEVDVPAAWVHAPWVASLMRGGGPTPVAATDVPDDWPWPGSKGFASALEVGGDRIGFVFVAAPDGSSDESDSALRGEALSRVAAHASWLVEVVTLEQILRVSAAMPVPSARALA